MNTERVGLLVLGLLLFTAGAPSAAAEITQTTGSGSWCSPAQNGNGNTVICNGVDPRALDRLNELLDRKDLDLKQKTAEANDWARRYTDLNAQLEETKKQIAAKGEDATLVETAQDLLHQGKLEEARAIFDRLLQSDEANVDRAAQDHFGRASVFALQFRFDEALPDYAEAYQYRPDDQRYALAYALVLEKQKDYLKAESVFQELTRQQRSGATQNPATYRPNLAWTLNALGVLYGTTNRFTEAEAAYKEAADIWRGLAAENPAAYRPYLAQTVDDLAILYGITNRFVEAEAAHKEAAGIWRELAAQNPAAYRPGLAWALENLGLFYGTANRFAEAEAAHKEAVGIWRELAAQNPAAYRSGLARALEHLGLFYGTANRFAEAEAAHKEAAGIERELAAQSPPPPTGPASLRRSTGWGFFTGTRTASSSSRRPTRRPSASGASWRRRTPLPTGPTSRRRSTAWAFFTEVRTASPTPKPPTRRLQTSSASWRRRTRPPTDPSSLGRSTTWAISIATRTSSSRPRPPTGRPLASGASWRRRTRPPTGPSW